MSKIAAHAEQSSATKATLPLVKLARVKQVRSRQESAHTRAHQGATFISKQHPAIGL